MARMSVWAAVLGGELRAPHTAGCCSQGRSCRPTSASHCVCCVPQYCNTDVGYLQQQQCEHF